jgi:hypothetical protein
LCYIGRSVKEANPQILSSNVLKLLNHMGFREIFYSKNSGSIALNVDLKSKTVLKIH